MPSPDHRGDPGRPQALRGDRTKRAILAKAVDIASVEGLEGLSIGRLASELGVSKSGLFAHFGSKLELQLETVQAASELFEEHVWQPGRRPRARRRPARRADGVVAALLP